MIELIFSLLSVLLSVPINIESTSQTDRAGSRRLSGPPPSARLTAKQMKAQRCENAPPQAAPVVLPGTHFHSPAGQIRRGRSVSQSGRRTGPGDRAQRAAARAPKRHTTE